MVEPGAALPSFITSPNGGRCHSVDDCAALSGILYLLQTGSRGRRVCRHAGRGIEVGRQRGVGGDAAIGMEGMEGMEGGCMAARCPALLWRGRTAPGTEGRADAATVRIQTGKRWVMTARQDG